MKDYLISFMNDFSYDEKDAAFLLSSYDKIIQNENTKALFDQCIARYNEDYMMDINTELLQPAEKECEMIGVHPFTTGLLLYICLSKHLKELYIEKNISLDELSLEEYQAISPVFQEDIYEAISMKTCVEKRMTIGAPGAEAMKQVIEVYKKELQ